MRFDKVIRVIDSDNQKSEIIKNKLGISHLTSRILVNRGIGSCEEAQIFLNPTLNNLHSPFLLKDMDKSVARICKAIEEDEDVWIYGDYDVDGVTSTSILMLFLNHIGLAPKFYIPDRMSEGYGLNQKALEYIKDQGGQLIITVDCGITSFDEAKFCKDNNLDIIITDHHQCKEMLPDAYSVINPNRQDCNYPFKKLAGVGVAFKLIQALSITLEAQIDYSEILPIVAIGTVADVVSLTGENRVIVKNGLKLIHQSSNLGIKSLLEITSLKEKEVTSGHIGFVIGPRINAGGRIGLAKHGVELFISNCAKKAKSIAQNLDDENNKRQIIEQRIMKEAIEVVEKDIDLKKEKIIVAAGENWHHGVIGIVSSRITEKYRRPSILISIEGNEARGSARSISSFDIYNGLSQCKDLFIKFGGHEQAAGLSIDKDNIPILRDRINIIADELLTDEDLITEIIVDSEITSNDITKKVIDELNLIKPYGIDNPGSQLLLKGCKVKSFKGIGKDEKHLKLTLENKNVEYACIGFNLGKLSASLNAGDIIDVVVSLEINEYMGKETIQLNIKDINIVKSIKEEIEDIYFSSLIKSIKNSTVNYNQQKNKNFNLYEDKDRLHFICKALKDETGILVLINNYFNLQEILNLIRLQGRNFIKKTDISYSFNCTAKENCIIVNPILDKININKYTKVFLYDLFFDTRNMNKLFSYVEDKKLMILSKQIDINLNKKILDFLVPTIDDLRVIYKSFLNSRENIFKVDIERYITSISQKNCLMLNKSKLKLALEILNESQLLDYKLDNKDCFIKMNNITSKKVDISSVETFNYYTQLKNNI